MSGGTETDAYENDPGRWGHSLVNLAEVVAGCLDAAGARSVAEVGSWAGDLTRFLLDWARHVDASVVAIDPTPHPDFVTFAERRADLELVREPSLDALRHVPIPDAIIIDGDHNYYTVSQELRLIDERSEGSEIPLLMFHDVGWPHGRRDSYWAPERIPDEHRQPVSKRPVLFPGDPGLVEQGLPMYNSARREGGPRNGVLTAIEDFLELRPELRLATVPAFFGFGVVWHREAPWAEALARFIEAWDRNPVLDRLEANRVYHLAMSNGRSLELARAEAKLERSREQRAEAPELEHLRARVARQEQVLRALLDSSGLRLADRLSALRHPGRDWSWPGRLRTALGESGGGEQPRAGAEPEPATAVQSEDSAPAEVTWVGDDRCVVGGITFQAVPVDYDRWDLGGIPMEGADFLLFKPRPLIERYVEWVRELRPRNVVELGVLEGGSAAFLREVARPSRLVTIDRKPPTVTALADFVAARGLEDELRIHTDVDQGDRERLAEIVASAFGEESLDLVVDDCSHLYEPSRASFNELFPRLRPGGLYTIEDWRWAHTELGSEYPEGMWPDETPLTRLLFEILLAIPSRPGLIADVNVELRTIEVRRGSAAIDPSNFDISDCSDLRGRSLLASR